MKCPKCKSPSIGTVEKVIAEMDTDPDTGHLEYTGTTELDTQYTVMRKGKALFGCLNCCHEWWPRKTLAQLMGEEVQG